MKPRYIFATVLYCLAVFWESSQSYPVKTSIHFPNDDKVAHILIYGGLAAIVSVGIRRSGKPVSAAWQCCTPIALAAAFGASDEFHQWYVPHRTADVFDFLADVAGAAIMQALLCGAVWRLWSVAKAETVQSPQSPS